MKKIKLFITMLIAVLSLINVSAQDYQRVEFDLGIKRNLLVDNISGGGVGLFLEPRYNVNNKMTVGLKLGFDVLTSTELKEPNAKANVNVLPSYVLTGDYMLMNKGNKRLFAGLGLGLSGKSSFQLTDAEPESPELKVIGNSFGIVPRVGAKLGIFKISVDYSIYTRQGAKDFLGVNIGLSFGGRVRK